MLAQILRSLHLDEPEIKTYSLLLDHGPITAGRLAKKIGVPRSSLYGYLQRLQDHGLVGESLRQGTKVFAAEPPEKLSLLFNQQIEHLEKSRQEFQQLLPKLRKRPGGKLLQPRLEMYEGADGLRSVLKDMLLYSDMVTHAFWPIRSMLDMLGADFFRYLNKERIRNNLYTRAIWPQSQVVELEQHPYLGIGPKFKREIRIAPAGVKFSMGYWIYGSRIAFISSQKESFGFVIESEDLVETLLSQFETIWNLSKAISVNAKSAEAFLDEIALYHPRLGGKN